MSESRVRPNGRLLIATGGLVAIGCAIGAFAGLGGEEFKPRATTIDALAGLAIGAFFVDRLLTFVPVFGFVRKPPQERSADLDVLRLGYGALLGGIFVSITNLPAVRALTDGKAGDVNADADQAIAVLAIAGGVAGLSRVLSGLNPNPKTDGEKSKADTEKPEAAKETPIRAADDTIDPPSPTARMIGVAGVVLAALAALHALGDKAGVELLASETQADGTVALVVRFATVLLAAAIVEQIVERTLGTYYETKANKPILTGALALFLGVLIAWIMDLYLLHNVGFFGTTEDLNKALGEARGVEIWFDAFVTGAVIASTTKPLHDLNSRLRKAKKPSAPPTPA